MHALRLCSRPACQEAARATLTYVYADSTAVLGPLATYPEPHCYDLCARHANGLTVPSGWKLIRGALSELPAEPEPVDELYALAQAVRERDARPELQENPAPETMRTARGARLDSGPRVAMLFPRTDPEES
ncbi:DUF3499 domain-containing protein [Glutamicibacter sp. PS]|uniref:DUF3499 domain-containing protein n=1 Tax=Glutamicibacter sp. PS TaxID=3075634 RepID=UPI00284E9DEA|nr:DUF3499 domain-containing protein [Glutamicibacter sp. PS]MDR4533646.1 DUF3499 domain-containing protein [Glutamicibacter sp. PS]